MYEYKILLYFQMRNVFFSVTVTDSLHEDLTEDREIYIMYIFLSSFGLCVCCLFNPITFPLVQK